ncbi:response regulator transcription factor [Jeotgalibacillus sp. R-1-5s-1]|uniref:response regulator transcription factor n=1 Tax=Jeotgalibacillus sp. R-1-5s-1 TaxID=2555897 RepID=UPI00106D3FDB|nr:response regulator transcription factor [Jeotgalibacillus sp. R-1-5s-1]TFD94399.1 response regulator transcription factor [Jeotgalibacillus sp. R-1-5s-1]
MNIFLVEDDRQIVEQMERHLVQWGFEVSVPTDFQDVMNSFREEAPHIVLMDIQLPAFDGFYWCREIRSESKVPIIFLSSRDHPMDQVMAMQLGADDYVQKPYNMEVLVAKIQAIARRTYEYQDTPAESPVQTWNGAQLDLKKGTLSLHNQTMDLTKNELYILAILLEHPNEIVPRDTLIRKLWDDERFVNDNTLTVNIGRLRQKVAELGMEDVIITKKGIGYMAVSR